MAIFGRTPKFYGQLDKILTEKNKSAIIKSSEDRKDGMFVNPLNHLSNQCHKNCLYEYTSKEKIKRYLTKRKNLDEAGTLRPRKSQRLSNVVTFEFETKYFFCGERATLRSLNTAKILIDGKRACYAKQLIVEKARRVSQDCRLKKCCYK